MMNDVIREMGLASEFPVVDGDLVNASIGQRSRQGSGGGEDGVISSVKSLARIADALFGGELLTASMMGEMLAPSGPEVEHSASDAELFGLGLRIVPLGKQRWALLVGDGAGGEALVAYELNSKRTFIALSNVFGCGIADKALERAGSLLIE